jgi:hypothetical protein
MQHLCKHCHKPIKLVPSAEERAKKYGGTPNFYRDIFTMHNECIMELRKQPMNQGKKNVLIERVR